MNIRRQLTANLIICQRALAGSAHWQNIAKAKAAAEKKQNDINSKWLPRIRKEARNGSNMEKNRNLKKLVEQALEGGALMPAIKKQINVWDNLEFKEFQLGVQGNSGFAALVECGSDAPKRTENDIQTLLRRYNFKFSSVHYMFNKTNHIMCQLPEDSSADEIEELALLCGTEDYITDSQDDTIIFCVDDSDEKLAVKELNDQQLIILSKSIHYKPKELITVSEKESKRRIGLFMENLSSLLEVENVYHNVMNMNEIRNKE